MSEPAPKKPELKALDGEGRSLTDTRPPVARFGRHTLPDAIVSIRRFVFEHGVLPPDVQASIPRLGAEESVQQAQRRRFRLYLPSWPWFAAGLVIVAVAVTALVLSGPRAQQSSPNVAVAPQHGGRDVSPMPAAVPTLSVGSPVPGMPAAPAHETLNGPKSASAAPTPAPTASVNSATTARPSPTHSAPSQNAATTSLQKATADKPAAKNEAGAKEKSAAADAKERPATGSDDLWR